MLQLHNFIYLHNFTHLHEALRMYSAKFSILSLYFVAFLVCNNAKRSKEGTQFCVKNKSKKKTRFKGKRFSAKMAMF